MPAVNPSFSRSVGGQQDFSGVNLMNFSPVLGWDLSPQCLKKPLTCAVSKLKKLLVGQARLSWDLYLVCQCPICWWMASHPQEAQQVVNPSTERPRATLKVVSACSPVCSSLRQLSSVYTLQSGVLGVERCVILLDGSLILSNADLSERFCQINSYFTGNAQLYH